jgi:type IV secretory pathway VirB3-like protein
MPPPIAQIVASPKPEKRKKREDRMRGEKRERTQREDKKGEDPRAEIFFGLTRAPVGFDFLAAPGLWFHLFKTAVTKNRLLFLVSAVFHFSCRLIKTADTKNKSLFLITVKIITWHHKKILCVTINRFSSSE